MTKRLYRVHVAPVTKMTLLDFCGDRFTTAHAASCESRSAGTALPEMQTATHASHMTLPPSFQHATCGMHVSLPMIVFSMHVLVESFFNKKISTIPMHMLMIFLKPS